MKFEKVVKWIFIVFILAGIVLSFVNFLNLRSLWLNEATIALNIVEKSVFELFRPLEHYQVAPIGFLLIEKLFASLLGGADWTMRIFPLISFLASIYLLFIASKKVVKNYLFALYTSAFFATSIIMISYSSELKQYMSDVTFWLIILISTINYNSKKFKIKWWIYAFIGALSICFSNISIILLFSSGLYTIYKTHYSIGKKYLPLLYILVIWMAAFIVYYFLFIYKHPTKDIMVNYWQSSFLPKDILSIEFYKSLLNKFEIYFSLLGNLKYPLLQVPFYLLGLWYLFKKKKALLFLLLSPLIFHLILSYFQLYPFDKRLILYLYPSLLIIITSGFYFIASFFKGTYFKLIFVLPFFLVMNLFKIDSYGFPIEKEEIKKSIAYMESKFRTGESLYVYYGAINAFNFYKSDLNINLDPINVVLATKHRTNWPFYRTEISKMNNSVWILFSHLYRTKTRAGLTEEAYILNTFRAEGYRIMHGRRYKGSSVYYAVKN